MKKKKGDKGSSGDVPQEPRDAAQAKRAKAPVDDAAVFATALEAAAREQGGAPGVREDRGPMPFGLRDFFAEFDEQQSEFLTLAEDGQKQEVVDKKPGRAERFAQRKIEDYLTFALQNEVYGVPISKVREIIKPMTLTNVPRQPAYVAGILSLRGAIVPVFSLSLRLGLEQGETQRSTRIVVFEDGEELLGFYVDEVREVVRMPVHAVEPPPQWRGAEHQDVIRGVGRVDSQMIILLEFDTLVSHLKAA